MVFDSVCSSDAIWRRSSWSSIKIMACDVLLHGCNTISMSAQVL